MNKLVYFILLGWAILCLPMASFADVVDFSELDQYTGSMGDQDGDGQADGDYYNGDLGIGSNSLGWSSGGVFFNNTYTEQEFDGELYEFWSGWAYSNVQNDVTPEVDNQYASYPRGGADGSGGVAGGENYALAYGSGAYFNLPNQVRLESLEISNTTYAALAMLDGDDFSKKFGGADGTDPDSFRVDLIGFDALGGATGSGEEIGRITIDLADYTFEDDSLDYILEDWLTVDLSSIADARSVGIEFSSSDVTEFDGEFFINTPTYFAMDNLTYTAVPEPTTAIPAALLLAGLVWHRSRRKYA